MKNIFQKTSSCSIFVRLLDGHRGVEQFQFVQTAPGHIVLRICAPQDVAADIEPALHSRIQADLGRDM